MGKIIGVLAADRIVAGVVEANQLAVSATGIRADPTGSSGLAGLYGLRRSGAIGDTDRAAVLFTGIQR